jgi:hypothetical protein
MGVHPSRRGREAREGAQALLRPGHEDQYRDLHFCHLCAGHLQHEGDRRGRQGWWTWNRTWKQAVRRAVRAEQGPFYDPEVWVMDRLLIPRRGWEPGRELMATHFLGRGPGHHCREFNDVKQKFGPESGCFGWSNQRAWNSFRPEAGDRVRNSAW